MTNMCLCWVLAGACALALMYCVQDNCTSTAHAIPHMQVFYMQAMAGSLSEVEWEGILHWKTWALASLDCCISTTKCASATLNRCNAELLHVFPALAPCHRTRF